MFEIEMDVGYLIDADEINSITVHDENGEHGDLLYVLAGNLPFDVLDEDYGVRLTYSERFEHFHVGLSDYGEKMQDEHKAIVSENGKLRVLVRKLLDLLDQDACTGCVTRRWCDSEFSYGDCYLYGEAIEMAHELGIGWWIRNGKEEKGEEKPEGVEGGDKAP